MLLHSIRLRMLSTQLYPSYRQTQNSQNIYYIVFSVLFFFLSCNSYIFSQNPNPKREFRGIWIATVENIDFPSNKFLSSDQQKQEFITIIDRLKKDKFI